MMKKVLIVLVVVLAVLAGVVYTGLSGMDGFIKEQIETQGSKVTQTQVSVAQVETRLAEAKMSISGLKVANPQGYSDADTFTLNTVRVDLGTSTQEPYVIEEILIDAPTVLYEVDKQGKANLTVLQENIQSSLPTSNSAQTSNDEANPLMSVNQVTVKDVKFKLNIEALELPELNLEKRQYEVTLPTFEAGAIGVPNGIPADQLGAAIVDAMLDNLIKEGKNKVKAIFEDKAKEKLDEEKQKLKEKAKDKLKDLLGG